MGATFEIRHGSLFCGMGGGAKGLNAARPDIGCASATFRCIGGIDSDPGAVADFERMTGVKGTVLDLFDREQFIAFHGREPGRDWREAMPADIHRAFGFERPHVVFLSAPCKGFSGLMPEGKSKTDKYQALNRLTLRGVWLMLEAFKDDPVEMVLFENVPRIASRGRALLDRIVSMLSAYGYAVAETTHDCGELGGLAQSRKRFLLVARHLAKVPPFLYEPARRPLQSVGAVLSRMPLAGDVGRAGPMHRVPSLQWKTWVRLAFVEAGKDWRSLNRLAVENGVLRDYLIVPESGGEWHRNVLGVHGWDDNSGTVTANARPTTGAFSVADPRAPEGAAQYSQYGVIRMDETAGAIIGVKSPGQGAFSVADPRLINQKSDGDAYVGNGHYGVIPYTGNSGAVSAAASHDNGRWSVADPRLPSPAQQLVCVIRSLDGTWHRPFTTLELAALQSLVDPEEFLELEGLSDQAWRERIGNAVPPSAAKAIGEEIGRTLLLAWTGQTFALGSTPIWVRNLALALTMPGANEIGRTS